jgi:prepilin-type N-terminal cleavage/methylation domain-containing protein
MSRSFTLIELVVVIAIMGLVLAFALPPVSSMWDQRHFAASIQQIDGMLQVARQRARAEMTAYGVWVFVDPRSDVQYALFIRSQDHGNPPEPVRHGPLEASYWNLYADMFTTVPGGYYRFGGGMRIGRLNNDLLGTVKFNNFVIIFGTKGTRDIIPQGYKYTIHDPDDDNDGFGDVTEMPVADLTGYWEVNDHRFDLLPQHPVPDLVQLFSSERYTEFDGQWGLRVYNHNEYNDLDGYPAEQVSYLEREARPMLLARDGKLIRAKR